MDIKFNIKRKYVVNGKEYGSLDEMPAAIREAYEKAVGKARGGEQGDISSIASGKIFFNGQEYSSVDSMPPDVRQMYETVMKTVNEGKISVTGNVDFNFGRKAPDARNGGLPDSYGMAKPIAPRSFFSPVILVLLGLIIALIAGLYLYTH